MPWGPAGESYRHEVCEAHAEWLRLGDVAAKGVKEGPEGRRPLILRKDGTAFSAEIMVPRTHALKTGNAVREALKAHLNARRGCNGRMKIHTVRLVCAKTCGQGLQCHGDNLAALGRELVAARDAHMAPAAPVKRRKIRSDKGTPRGPRKLQGGSRYRIGMLSLYRYRYGMERQVSQATRDAVAKAEENGERPWMAGAQGRSEGGGSDEGAECRVTDLTGRGTRAKNDAGRRRKQTTRWARTMRRQ